MKVWHSIALCIASIGCMGQSGQRSLHQPLQPAMDPNFIAQTEFISVTQTLVEILRENDLGSRPDGLPSSLRSTAKLSKLKMRLEVIKPKYLPRRDRALRHSLLHGIRNLESASVCRSKDWTVNPINGLQLATLRRFAPRTVIGPGEVEWLAQRYARLAHNLVEHAQNLSKGLEDGYVAARINVGQVLGQIDAQLDGEIATSPYLGVYGQPDSSEPAPTKLIEVIKNNIYPSLVKYADVLKHKILPQARTQVGLTNNIPMGGSCYRALIRLHVGIAMAPMEIHTLGKRLVDNLRGELKRRVVTLGGGDPEAYLAMLQAAPEQHVKSTSALLEQSQAFVARLSENLYPGFNSSLHGHIGMRAMEGPELWDAPAAKYLDVLSAQGVLTLNAQTLESRYLYNLPALVFNGTLPGRHLQRHWYQGGHRDLWQYFAHDAFVEGWAAYSELVAGQLGGYRTPQEELGALTYRLWRASLLVVDTGIHHLGWSRQEAIDYLSLKSGHDSGEVVQAIDAAIAEPGRALAAGIGEIEFSELRQRAEETLGDGFDMAAFHDRVLSLGPVPLIFLRQDILDWLGPSSADQL